MPNVQCAVWFYFFLSFFRDKIPLKTPVYLAAERKKERGVLGYAWTCLDKQGKGKIKNKQLIGLIFFTDGEEGRRVREDCERKEEATMKKTSFSSCFCSFLT